MYVAVLIPRLSKSLTAMSAKLLRRSWFVLVCYRSRLCDVCSLQSSAAKIVLGGCILASMIAAILVTVNVFMVDFTVALEPEGSMPSPLIPIDPICESLPRDDSYLPAQLV